LFNPGVKTLAKSKTDHIREFIAKNPTATGKQAAEALKKHGISAQYFYTIKSNLSKPKKRGKKKAAAKVVQRRVRKTTTDLNFDDLQAVAEFAGKIGGLDKLSDAVTALRKFQLAD